MVYTNIYSLLKEQIISAAIKIFAIEKDKLDVIAIEIPREKQHGDLSTNAAMIIAGIINNQQKDKTKPKTSAQEIARLLIQELSSNPEIAKIDIAGPGFINFTLQISCWHNILQDILECKNNFGQNQIGNNQKVNIEFVSANPTGPMHIGHARGAVYGDVLARVMQFSGYEVTREYYVNDAGSQITTLTASAYLRYEQAFGKEITIPEGYYPGEYLIEIANIIKSQYGDRFINPSAELLIEFRKIVLDNIMNLIKQDLSNLKIHHDVFFSEASLHQPQSNGKDTIANTIDILLEQGLAYYGAIDAPKGHEQESDVSRANQLLFKATDFGDDQDRSLTKNDDSWTYFAGDIAYAKSKIDRGFSKNVIILGADHAGYVKRLQAVYKSLSGGKSSAEIILTQMVNFIENGEPVKMSKRAGKFSTVADVINAVGPDILRFIMLTRKNDIILDFDLDLVKSQSRDNPIFYVQYALVRGLSILENARINHNNIYSLFLENKYDLTKLTTPPEIEIIKLLSLWIKVVSAAATTSEIHRIAFYLQDLASAFHAFWNLGKESANYRFLISEEVELSVARLALVEAVINVIKIALTLVGVEPMNKM